MSSVNPAPFPHFEIHVKDNSITTIDTSTILPCNRQLYMTKTQRGIPNVPVWCPDYTTAARIFGEQTFNLDNKSFCTNASYFLINVFQRAQGAFITRLVDPNATKSIIIFEVVVTTEEAIVQYQKDDNGNRIIDVDNSTASNIVYLTEKDDEGADVTAPGIRLTWHARHAYSTGEAMDTLKVVTTVVGGQTRTTYPIYAIEASSVGAWGNEVGVKLFYNEQLNTSSNIGRLGAVQYSLGFIEKDYGKTTTSPLRTKLKATSVDFVAKPNTVDPANDLAVSLDKVIQQQYTGNSALPLDMHMYSANIETVGNLVADAEDQANILNGWYANILTGIDSSGVPYDKVVVVNDVDIAGFGLNIINYMSGGTDGDLSDYTTENQLQSFLKLSLNSDIVDRARYPFNHIVDVGWSFATKKRVIDFLATRDDIALDIATQDCSTVPLAVPLDPSSSGSAYVAVDGLMTITEAQDTWLKANPKTPVKNNMAQDVAAALSLRSRSLLMVESTLRGTPCFRSAVWYHCAYTADNYTGLLPFTFWSAIKHAEYQNKDYIAEVPAGIPNASITCFDIETASWIPAGDDVKEDNWNAGGNYCAYYEMDKIHYAMLRTVYPYETSVLISLINRDALVYAKHEIRRSWAQFAGVQWPEGTLNKAITDDINTRLGRLFNNMFFFKVTVYRTAEDTRIRYARHVRVEIYFPDASRVWVVDVECNSESQLAA